MAVVAVFLDMKLILPAAKCILAAFAVPSLLSSANAALVITFDDLYGGYGALVPSSYAGFTWGPDWALYTDAIYQGPYGNTYGSPSPPNFVFPTGVAPSRIVSSPTLFNFISAEVSTFSMNDAFYDWSSTSITVEGYNGASLVGSVTMPLTVGFQTLTANFDSIDSLVFSNDGIPGHYSWALDNFTYANVPEPAALTVIAGLGLVGFGAFRRVRA